VGAWLAVSKHQCQTFKDSLGFRIFSQKAADLVVLVVFKWFGGEEGLLAWFLVFPHLEEI